MQLWWHLYGADIPEKGYACQLLIGGTDKGPDDIPATMPFELGTVIEDGTTARQLPRLGSWDHRPTIAEQNAVRIFGGLDPEVPADNVDDYGDDLDGHQDDDW